MSQAQALKRLAALEARSRRQSLEPYARDLAAQVGLDVDELTAEADRIRQRIDAVGEDRASAELAAEWGISIGQLRAEIAAVGS